MDIKQIIKGCKNADRNAQKELYILTAKEVMNVCYRYMQTSEKAKDIFQDTYIKALQKIEQYDIQKGNVGAWVCKIAANLCIDKLRRAKKIVFVEDIKDSLLVVDDSSIIGKIKADELLKLVAKLSENHRLVFNLYVVEGYSHKEIAEILNIQVTTSRAHLLRARTKLQAMLKNLSPKHKKKEERINGGNKKDIRFQTYLTDGDQTNFNNQNNMTYGTSR